jgi:hypothetical protein
MDGAQVLNTKFANNRIRFTGLHVTTRCDRPPYQSCRQESHPAQDVPTVCPEPRHTFVPSLSWQMLVVFRTPARAREVAIEITI